MTELLPCPFCGGTAKIVRRDVEPQGDPWYGSNLATFVECLKCGCCLFDERLHDGFVDDEDAATAWNGRAQ
jgi:C4-type Zn-finger protein